MNLELRSFDGQQILFFGCVLVPQCWMPSWPPVRNSAPMQTMPWPHQGFCMLRCGFGCVALLLKTLNTVVRTPVFPPFFCPRTSQPLPPTAVQPTSHNRTGTSIVFMHAYKRGPFDSALCPLTSFRPHTATSNSVCLTILALQLDMPTAFDAFHWLPEENPANIVEISSDDDDAVHQPVLPYPHNAEKTPKGRCRVTMKERALANHEHSHRAECRGQGRFCCVSKGHQYERTHLLCRSHGATRSTRSGNQDAGDWAELRNRFERYIHRQQLSTDMGRS